jgi:hypothetical protein
VGELADFSFTIKYRPGHTNGDADALSRMPLDIATYMASCNREVKEEDIKAVTAGIRAQNNGDAIWIAAVSHDSTLLDLGDQLAQEADLQSMQPSEMLEAQKGDPTIGRVLAMKTEGHQPVGREVRLEPPATRSLLRHWQKLNIGEEGLLRRHTGPNKQLILPRKYHRLIYKELHQEMGHLGPERVIQLARE